MAKAIAPIVELFGLIPAINLSWGRMMAT